MRTTLLVFLFLSASPFAIASETALFFNSTPGDYIGGGEQQYYTPSDLNFFVSRNGSQGVSFNINNNPVVPVTRWSLDFSAPGNAVLMPGVYLGAARYGFQSPSQPGLSVTGMGKGCSGVTGSFTILEAVYGPGGTVERFAADFVQHCEGLPPALYGSIRFNSLITAAIPGVSSVSPSTILGGSDATLTINGTNFSVSSIAKWNGESLDTTFQSDVQLSVLVPASLLMIAGTAEVAVFTPGTGGGTSNAITVTSLTPVAVVGSLSPSSAPAAGPGLVLTVNGFKFMSDAIVQWNGLDRTTTFVSSTRLTASIPAGDIASPGTAQVRVFNPGPGGAPSNAVTITIGNPIPVLTSLSPPNIGTGTGAFTLTVSGSNFVPGAVVRWKGSNRPTTYVNSTQLRASIFLSDTVSVGTAAVAVLNPLPVGGLSNSILFSVSNSIATISSLTPTSAVAGSAAFTLTVFGSNFSTASLIQWNGNSRVASFVSPTRLTTLISANDIATPGKALVTVLNSGAGGDVSVSAPKEFAIEPGSSYSHSYYFAQIAAGNNWQTIVTYINYSSHSVTCLTTFWDDAGAPLMIPIGGTPYSSRTDVLPAGGTLRLESTMDPAVPMLTGWAKANCNGPLKAGLLFRTFQQGVVVAEASVNATTVPTTKFTTFASALTGVAFANPSAELAHITFSAMDTNGAKVGSAALSLVPGAHGAVFIGSLLGLSELVGSVQIVSSVPIISLSLNFDSLPVFSSLPPGELDSFVPLSSEP